MTLDTATTAPPALDAAAGLPELYTPAMLADPYPVYRALRERDPVHWTGWSWLVTRFTDVQAALRDPRLRAARAEPDPTWLAETGLGPLFAAHNRMMLFADPPAHTRLRSLVGQAFTPRAVAGLRARIQHQVDALIDQVADAGAMDLIADVARPLPVTVIAELLGVPLDMRVTFARWSESMAAFIGGAAGADEALVLQRAQRDVLEMTNFFLSLAAERRAAPRDDLLSALALAEAAGDRLTEEELVANCILLLVAGHETTTNLIGNGVLALLHHPDELARLRERPDLVERAVEELLRYDSPVQTVSRIAATDLTIGGRQIHAGQYVELILGAANRDPAQFPAPDRLDVARPDVRHLAFAHGPHYCVGAPLARLEGQIAIGALVGRLPGMRLADAALAWRASYALRGLVRLPLVWGR